MLHGIHRNSLVFASPADHSEPSVSYRGTTRCTRAFPRFAPALLLLLGFAAKAGAQPALDTPVDPSDPVAAPDAPAPTLGAEATPTTEHVAPEPAAAPARLRSGEPSTFPPLDLCTKRPAANAARYQRQRIVLLNPHVDPSASESEQETNANGDVVATHRVLADVHAGEMARLILVRGLAMPRFYTVISPVPAPASVLTAQSLALAQAREAAGNDGFASYSLGCADWLVVPAVRRTRATWKKVEKEKTVYTDGKSQKVKYLGWDLSTGWVVSLRIFKREGGGFTFMKTLDGGTGGLEGAAAGLAASSPEARPLHEYSSTWPTADCAMGEPVDGQSSNVSSCAALVPRLSAELPSAVPASGGSCSGVADEVAGGLGAMRGLARCEVARAVEGATRLLQRNAKRFAHWELRAELLAVNGSDRGIPMGSSDGVRRGDYWVARSGAPGGQKNLGFARVVELGGGGDSSPSLVKFKSGDAPVGAQMHEYALLGVQFGLRPGVVYLLAPGDLETTFGYGGQVSIGYDTTRLVGWLDETWLRANAGYFVGTSEETLVSADLVGETTSYFGGGVAGTIGLGLSALIPTVRREPAPGAEEVTWSGASIGGLVELGLEYAFSPDWSAALLAQGRTGFSKAELKSDQVTTRLSAGSLTGALALLTVGHTF